MKSIPKKSLPWDEVERQISKEMFWLRNVIETFHEKDENSPVTCKECLLRKIAILIISGKVKATEITKKHSGGNFWLSKKSNNKLKISHGKEWHQKTMEEIESHFLQLGFKVAREPNLHWGRADLGIYKKDERDLLVEVGTTTFFKLWVNLSEMKNFILLVVPNDDRLIEFVSC